MIWPRPCDHDRTPDREASRNQRRQRDHRRSWSRLPNPGEHTHVGRARAHRRRGDHPDRVAGSRGWLDPVRLRLGRRARGIPATDQRSGGRRPCRAGDSVRTQPEELATAVSRGDKAMVARANGVGPKLAQRIVNELAGKLGSPALAGAIGAALRAAARRPMPCLPSPTWASSQPRLARRSTPPMRSLARTPASMRWSAWRCARPRNDHRALQCQGRRR